MPSYVGNLPRCMFHLERSSHDCIPVSKFLVYVTSSCFIDAFTIFLLLLHSVDTSQ